MIIALISAMGRNRVIGINNTLPWRLPADLKHFKQITMGKPVLMGRKTYESIGKPLPGRTNIIISRDGDYRVPGCIVAHSIDAALASAAGHEEIMVIGGAALYQQMLPRADRLYLTLIDEDFKGDAWFPEIQPEQWQEQDRVDHEPDAANPYHYSFMTLQRISRTLP
jgi:dihydrofolate reductase